jgi:pteridine reductase
MDMGLKGKNAIICASSRGLGKGCAKALASEGVDLVINGRNQEVLTSTANEIRNKFGVKVIEFCADITSKDSQSKLLELCPAPDILINNASKFYPTKIDTVNDKNWTDIINTNLKTPLFLSKSFFPELKKRKGSIINIIDIHVNPPLKNHIIYNLSKAGLLALTQSLAKDLAPSVRVNGVSPGAIMWPKSINKKRKKEIISKIALQRIGEPNDIAKTILFLITNGNYITGQNINVDGGRRLNM